MSRPRPSAGIVALAVFFAFGAVVAGGVGLSLLLPGGPPEAMWRLNPEGREVFGRLGGWAVLLMLGVSAACASTALGLGRLAAWGRRLALAMLSVNLAADAIAAVALGDWRRLIGLPIAGALVAWLLSAGVRRQFAARAPG